MDMLRKAAIQTACCGAGGGADTGFTYERAPEPSDILWENLAVSKASRLCRVIMTYIATFILVGACFGILYAINIANEDLQK
jgi:Fe-S oxidoreductase